MASTSRPAEEGGSADKANNTADYDALFKGSLRGLLQWAQFEALWARLRAAPDGWYVRDFKARGIPEQPLSSQAFLQFLDEAEDFLRKRHREEYCGFIYLDDLEHPSFIKVFDPRKMGSACGCGGAVQPRWTISRQLPRLADDGGDTGGRNRKDTEGGSSGGGWLRRLFGG